MTSSLARIVGSSLAVCAWVVVGCDTGTSTTGGRPSGGSSLCHCNAPGATCVASDDCQAGYYCGPSETCAKAGSGTAGSSCSSDADCASGLRCDVTGFSAQCEPEGTGNVGGACTSANDCLAGLACVGGSCDPLGPSDGGVPIAVPTWTGETCMDVSGPTQAYFRVPRGTDDGDFYRLPFPNDVRLSGGHVSLRGHPTPGPALLGFDVVDRWLRDLEATVDGFSTYPTVFFRFSAAVDIGGTLKAKGAVQFLDITDPTKPVAQGFAWVANTGRGAYICDDWMAVKPPGGAPLTPGHTYAVIIASTVKDANGAAIQSSTDLQALLGSSAPSDATLATAWNQYAPLRAWASAQGVAASSILDAAQFTVGHPAAIGPKLPSAVAAAPAPTATSWIRCGDKPSPCPQATGDRACGTPDPSFDELHAMITLPIFQKGNEPYATPADGGDFVLASDGTPQMQRTEQVCMALTVPNGATMPAAGWPLLVYAHGTGGSFRSHVTEGVAKREAAQGIAVLGIDQVEHGTRRGTSQTSPDQLFYDFTNPAAARGNPLQGAVDQLSLVRFASTFDLAASQSPTGAEIKAGPVAFWGHSQGATVGGIAMPYAAGVLGAVFSGEGASLEDALVNKTNPINIAAALPIVLEDAHVDTNHPVLALLQNDLGIVDPLNHAGALVQTPVAAADQKHVFQPFGQGDTYAPPITEQIFAIAAHLTEAAPPSGVTGSPLVGMAPSPVPLGGNAMIGGKSITAVVRQYAPGASYDGHFVSYDDPAAEADVDHFLADALAGKVPMVGR
ncbi:MAG TPA: hypothetical protein VF765_01075 [Polyangiaceae bacterium]